MTASVSPPARLARREARTAEEEIEALWAMTRAERVAAMWRSQLTRLQLSKWSSRTPHEVPLLGDEFAWIAMRTPEWAEAKDPPPAAVEPARQRPSHDHRAHPPRRRHPRLLPPTQNPTPRQDEPRGVRPVLREPQRAPTRRPQPVLLNQPQKRCLELPRLWSPRWCLRRRARQRPHPPLSDRPDDRPQADRTPRPATDRPRAAPHAQPPPRSLARTRDRSSPVARPAPQGTDHHIARWQAALSRHPGLLARLDEDRGWRYRTMRALELGIDRGRITIPIRNARHELRGVLCYQPEPTTTPKMVAAPGAPLGLIPHPATDHSKQILLVEGPPDMIAARSRGLAAIAVPSDHAWHPAWAELLAGRRIAIVMDADDQGRAAAKRIAARPREARRRANHRSRTGPNRRIRPHGLAAGASRTHPSRYVRRPPAG